METAQSTGLKCPDHDCLLIASDTQYGTRFFCPRKPCTVVCWDGPTSTPANEETRALRQKCHKLFDYLWKKRKRWRHRNGAYRWLATYMGLPVEKAHFGMFTAQQCERAIERLKQLISERPRR